MPTASVRGTPLREAVRWYGRSSGDAGLRELVAAMPASVRHELHPELDALGLLPATWYPMALAHPLLDQIAGDRGAAERAELANELGAAIINATLSGTYGALFRWMATPPRYARFADRLWRMYFDCGRMSVTLDPAGTSAMCEVADWPGHHDFLCELNRAAATEVYRAMGCKSVSTTRTACTSDGSRACCFKTSWQ